jgi:diguanylate cyclase (GGDEF)-like protein
VLAEVVGVRGNPRLERVVVAEPVDLPLLGRLAAIPPETSVSLLDEGRVVVTNRPDWAATVERAKETTNGAERVGGLIVLSRGAASGVPWQLVVAAEAPSANGLRWAVGGATLVALVLTLLVGWRIARSLTRPLEDLGDAAARIAQGELDLRVPVRGRGEVALLGEKFNDMTVELQRTIAALERSRDDMSANLRRLGETLKSTHDLDKLMELVVETAITMVDADGGCTYAREGQTFRLVAERGLGGLGGSTGSDRQPPDEGVLGAVTVSAGPVRGSLGSGPDDVRPGPADPSGGHVLASVLLGRDRLVGVLVLYRRPASGPFTGAEEESLRTFAEQAGIAVENVILHRDAERLAITDPLTGIWNFRYLSMSLAREIDRAARFGRPLAVLMLDLDHFKDVNDTYGHARGDAVLRELAARVAEQVREVDTLARYGGEEFVLVLPETTPDGAAILAERICGAIRRQPFGLENGDEPPLRVTASIGVAAFPRHGGSPATLMHAADEALYVAKRTGRDSWRLASDPPADLDEAPPLVRPRRLDLEAHSRRAEQAEASSDSSSETIGAGEDLG